MPGVSGPVGHLGSQDPSDPFPALLATAQPQAAPSSVGDGDGSNGASAAARDKADAGVASPAHPEIALLGPLHVAGLTASGHSQKVAALAALLHLRPGRTAAWLAETMDPVRPWGIRTLQNRLTEIRSRFGTAPDGKPYLPRPKNGCYTFHPDVRSDWDRFQHLARTALGAGPLDGLSHLEDALGMVRGKPFEGGDFPWAAAVQQEMLARIVDVAHTLATWHAEADKPDLDAARHAALRGLDIDESAEVLYRDWITIERAAGNSRGLRRAITQVHAVMRTYDIALDVRTEQCIEQALASENIPEMARQTRR
jgi:hypothetical protein